MDLSPDSWPCPSLLRLMERCAWLAACLAARSQCVDGFCLIKWLAGRQAGWLAVLAATLVVELLGPLARVALASFVCWLFSCLAASHSDWVLGCLAEILAVCWFGWLMG